MDVQYTYFFAMGIEGIGDVLADIGDGTDGDDDTVSVRCAVVVEEVVASSCDFGNLVHVVLDDIRQGVVEGVRRFAVLEVDIRIFCGAADDRMVRVQGAGTEFCECLPVDEGSQFIVVKDFYLLDFMARTEAIEEVDEGDPAFDGSQVGNAGEVHDFLDVRFSQHGAARSPGAHDILVVAENGQGMVGQGTGGDMEYARQQFAGYLVHVRNHEEHPLGCGVGGGECPTLEGAVESTGSAAFSLHFYHMHRITEEVLLAMGSPFIHRFRHGGGRGNGVNRSYFCKGVGNIGGCCIAVHCFYFSHRINTPL